MKDGVISIEDMVVQSILHSKFCAGLGIEWNLKNEKIPQEVIDLYKEIYKEHRLSIVDGNLHRDIGDLIFPYSLLLEQLFILLILPTEKHYNAIPDHKIEMSKWGISRLTPNKNCGIKYILKRIRNALVHNHFEMRNDSRDSAFVFFDSRDIKNCSISGNEFKIEFSSIGLRTFINNSVFYIYKAYYSTNES